MRLIVINSKKTIKGGFMKKVIVLSFKRFLTQSLKNLNFYKKSVEKWDKIQIFLNHLMSQKKGLILE